VPAAGWRIYDQALAHGVARSARVGERFFCRPSSSAPNEWNRSAANRLLEHPVTTTRKDPHGKESKAKIQPQRRHGRRERDAPLQEGHGKERSVKSRKQAIAIGLSKARKEGKKVPRKK
jgi:hypothetical protein